MSLALAALANLANPATLKTAAIALDVTSALLNQVAAALDRDATDEEIAAAEARQKQAGNRLSQAIRDARARRASSP